jgi:SAP domain-containing ribonucleoprotein
MESKLKALKVADLKAVLTQAGLDTNGKKQDLISRIIDNKTAREIVEPPTTIPPQPHGDTASDPTPPSVATQVTACVATETEPAQVGLHSTNNLQTSSDVGTDDDLEKRRKRAERFGIPLIESSQLSAETVGLNNSADKLKERAERFGTGSGDMMDAEEIERRRKRAERFGTK